MKTTEHAEDKDKCQLMGQIVLYKLMSFAGSWQTDYVVGLHDITF